MSITLDQLKQITKQKESILIPFVDHINKTILQFVINSNLKLSHFLAQACHESGAFLYTEELASGNAYDTRVDLGNTPQFDGDGKLFKGRGLIQLTGLSNYKRISEYFKVDFVSQPKLLQTPEWASKSAGWFWNTKGLNELANQNDFLLLTYKVNGGFNGLKDRLKYLKLSLNVLNVPDSDILIKDIYNKISQNLIQPQTNHYKKALAKAMPDQKTLLELKNYLDSI